MKSILGSKNTGSITSDQKTKIQEQINKLQTLIDKLNTLISQVDAYKQQINNIRNQIGEAENKLNDLKTSLINFQKLLLMHPDLNYLTDKLDDFISKLIPAEFLPYAVIPNTKYKDQQYTQAVPIEVKWQDDKPDDKYVNGVKDDKSVLNAIIYYSVYRPESQRKVHETIGQILDFPYKMENSNYYRPTQLITYSKDRDVSPFNELLNKLYGPDRPVTYGLFNMLESWGHIHIGY
jgi:predicted SAM-dependent methyltransferase